jgi:hypothetical protein
MIGTKAWWQAALTRAIKTAAQAGVASIAVTTLWQLDVHEIIGIVGIAALVSILTSLAGLPEVGVIGDPEPSDNSLKDGDEIVEVDSDE